MRATIEKIKKNRYEFATFQRTNVRWYYFLTSVLLRKHRETIKSMFRKLRNRKYGWDRVDTSHFSRGSGAEWRYDGTTSSYSKRPMRELASYEVDADSVNPIWVYAGAETPVEPEQVPEWFRDEVKALADRKAAGIERDRKIIEVPLTEEEQALYNFCYDGSVMRSIDPEKEDFLYVATWDDEEILQHANRYSCNKNDFESAQQVEEYLLSVLS